MSLLVDTSILYRINDVRRGKWLLRNYPWQPKSFFKCEYCDTEVEIDQYKDLLIPQLPMCRCDAPGVRCFNCNEDFSAISDWSLHECFEWSHQIIIGGYA